MIKIDGLKAYPSQIFRVPIEQGLIKFQLDHKPSVQMWFLSVEFGSFICNGIRVCADVNLLQQYSKLIPFGVYIQIPSGIEPTMIDDFSSGRVIFNVVTQDEVSLINTGYQS